MKSNNLPVKQSTNAETLKFRILGSEIEFSGEKTVPVMIGVIHALMAAAFCLIALPMLAAMTAHLNNNQIDREKTVVMSPPLAQAMSLYQTPLSEAPILLKAAISNAVAHDPKHQNKTTRL